MVWWGMGSRVRSAGPHLVDPIGHALPRHTDVAPSKLNLGLAFSVAVLVTARLGSTRHLRPLLANTCRGILQVDTLKANSKQHVISSLEIR
jgi:hypothetical protein